jgi:aminoglycoside phosphotransferase
MSGVVAALAPDPVLVRRDDLLDTDALCTRLAVLLGIEVEGCERVRATYHPRRSLRLLLRVEHGSRTAWISARMFPRGTSSSRVTRARAAAGDAVFHDPELETLFFVFPADRKLLPLRRLLRREWPSVGTTRIASTRVVAYAPERAATVATAGADGRTSPFVKVLAGDAAGRAARAHRVLRARGIRCPDVVASWPRLQALALEPLGGQPLAESEDVSSWHSFGAELARLHATPPLDDRRAARLDPDALAAAANVIAGARPDAAAAASTLEQALRRCVPRKSSGVCLHGDVHAKNVLVDDAGAQLLDLDDVAAGPAAVDLGSALAGLRYDELLGQRRPDCAVALLEGYASRAPLPDAQALRWHTTAALLAERALRSITRLRHDGLEHLGVVLAAGQAELG